MKERRDSLSISAEKTTSGIAKGTDSVDHSLATNGCFLYGVPDRILNVIHGVSSAIIPFTASIEDMERLVAATNYEHDWPLKREIPRARIPENPGPAFGLLQKQFF